MQNYNRFLHPLPIFAKHYHLFKQITLNSSYSLHDALYIELQQGLRTSATFYFYQDTKYSFKAMLQNKRQYCILIEISFVDVLVGLKQFRLISFLVTFLFTMLLIFIQKALDLQIRLLNEFLFTSTSNANRHLVLKVILNTDTSKLVFKLFHHFYLVMEREVKHLFQQY